MRDEDEPTTDVPLPRRPSRLGEGRIGEAHTRLYGDRGTAVAGGTEAGADVGAPGPAEARWGAVEDRERSAALARAAVARPRTPVVDATGPGRPAEDPAEVSAGELADQPHEEPAGDVTPTAAPPREDRGARAAWIRRPPVPAVLAAAVVLVVGVILGLVIGQASASPTAAAPPLPGWPTMLGQVVSVQDGRTLTVQVAGRPVDVVVLGLDTPDPATPARPEECGAGPATAFAADRLTGELVTLVPDPSVGEFDDRGRRQVYVVLRSQLSYTDLALGEGVGRRSTTPVGWYDDVFVQGEATAREAGAGIWGAPCRAGL